jgi:methionine-S-sulfoxide reductase
VNLKVITIFAMLNLFASGLAAAKEQVPKIETATFAAGCYWGTEEFFRKIPGVTETRVGFTGGTVDHPKYEDTNDGHTGHAESVELKFDPSKVSYEHLLDQFFKMHDPTTKDRQGNDKGNQYRSAIFYHGEKQKEMALAFKKKVEKSGAWKAPIVTEIAEAKTFWPAEEDHQKYLVKNPGGYDNHYLRKLSFESKLSYDSQPTFDK